MAERPDEHTVTQHSASAPRHASRPEHQWRSAVTRIEPNSILVQGYPVDELMGRLSFAEAVYLILRGELPTPDIGRLFAAVLVSSIDHGVTPPSTLAARNVATTGAPLSASVASGVLAFGAYHGGDVETCMRFLGQGLKLVREGTAFDDVARELVRECRESGTPPAGFGHRVHTRDPRAIRLLQMAHELELDGNYIRLARALERALVSCPEAQRPLPLNVNGAIAAVCGDLGFPPELGNAMFIIARVPGLIAHAFEERMREKPMRLIDPSANIYDGPPVRRLPETRK